MKASLKVGKHPVLGGSEGFPFRTPIMLHTAAASPTGPLRAVSPNEVPLRVVLGKTISLPASLFMLPLLGCSSSLNALLALSGLEV